VKGVPVKGVITTNSSSERNANNGAE
jgi:hypothetical protein